MILQGRIKLINPTQEFTSGFKKREIVIITQEQYPQEILIEFHQDKISVLDGYRVGDVVNISINLRGREWINPEGEAKYFNTIVGWKIERDLTSPAPTQQPANEPDDLPF